MPVTKYRVKAVIYIRYSPRPMKRKESAGDDGQVKVTYEDESESTEKQLERCREYCEQQGYEVSDSRIFIDEGKSGMDDEKDPDPQVCIRKRPGLMKALEATGKGMVLVVRWRNRLAREPYILECIKRIVAASWGLIEAADENNETGVGQEIVDSVQTIMGRNQVEKIRFMTKLKMGRYQDSGRRMGRADRTPFGWVVDPVDPDRLIIDQREQEIIEVIMEMHEQGQTPAEICRILNQTDMKRRGKTWKNARGTVQSIIDRRLARILQPDAASTPGA
jgi:DNA invertase Pin-like site-specific DNA recombinase